MARRSAAGDEEPATRASAALSQMPQLPVRVDAIDVAVAEGEAEGVATDEVGVLDRGPITELDR